MTHNERKSQLTETDPEMTHMIDSLDRDIKSYYYYHRERGWRPDQVQRGGKIR